MDTCYIKVWCEYDFSGNFGGNNNEEVFEVPYEYNQDKVDKVVVQYLSTQTGLDEEELEDLYGWEYIQIGLLEGGE